LLLKQVLLQWSLSFQQVLLQ
jgi:hypothetical protein